MFGVLRPGICYYRLPDVILSHHYVSSRVTAPRGTSCPMAVIVQFHWNPATILQAIGRKSRSARCPAITNRHRGCWCVRTFGDLSCLCKRGRRGPGWGMDGHPHPRSQIPYAKAINLILEETTAFEMKTNTVASDDHTRTNRDLQNKIKHLQGQITSTYHPV